MTITRTKTPNLERKRLTVRESCLVFVFSFKFLFSDTLAFKLILAFSARKNFNELTRADDSNPALSLLYGMRTIAIFMIIMDHRFGTYISGPSLNYDFIEEVFPLLFFCSNRISLGESRAYCLYCRLFSLVNYEDKKGFDLFCKYRWLVFINFGDSHISIIFAATLNLENALQLFVILFFERITASS